MLNIGLGTFQVIHPVLDEIMPLYYHVTIKPAPGLALPGSLIAI